MDKLHDKKQINLLIKNVQKGHVGSFETLVTTYQNKVYRLCYQLSGNHDDAQDLAQDVFIKAYGAIKGFRLEADFGTWLHRIAVNLWLNVKKKAQRNETISIDEPVRTSEGEVTREVPAPRGNPLDIIEETEFRSLVRTALDQLSYEHKAVLLLRDIEGYTYEEIASMLNCSLGTVKSRLNRARQVMREKIRQIESEYKR